MQKMQNTVLLTFSHWRAELYTSKISKKCLVLPLKVNSLIYSNLGGKLDCPKEKGYCLKSKNRDQNSGVIKFDGFEGNTEERHEKCLAKCQSFPGATGCEMIWRYGMVSLS